MTILPVISIDTDNLDKFAGRKLTQEEIDTIVFLYHEELANNFNTEDIIQDIMKEELGL